MLNIFYSFLDLLREWLQIRIMINYYFTIFILEVNLNCSDTFSSFLIIYEDSRLYSESTGYKIVHSGSIDKHLQSPFIFCTIAMSWRYWKDSLLSLEVSQKTGGQLWRKLIVMLSQGRVVESFILLWWICQSRNAL